MVNSIVSLVTLPKPIVTSEFEFDSSTSADTWDAGRAIIIKQINSTLNWDIITYLIYLPHIKNRFLGNTNVTNSVSSV